MGRIYLSLILTIASATAHADLAPVMAVMAPSTYSTHTADSRNLSCPDVVSVVNPKGNEIVKLCKSDYRSCKFEGACVVETGEGKVILAYHSYDEIKNQTYFTKTKSTDCQFGFGFVSGKVYQQLKTRDLCLDPFFSVAADLTAYNIGDVLYVPDLVGVQLPSGETHDGYVIVRDSSAFHERAGNFRITFFTGFLNAEHRDNVFAKMGLTDIDNHKLFRSATQEEAKAARLKRNFPGLP